VKKNKKSNYNSKVSPLHIYRVVVEPSGGGMYPRYEKFWHIEKWDKKQQRYWRCNRGGLAFTRWGMWRAIRKELKRLNAGSYAEYYAVNGERID